MPTLNSLPEVPQMALRLSINPTYDSRKTGPRFEVATRVNGRLNYRRKIIDPFVRTTVKVGWGAMLSALFRLTRVEVEVRVSGDNGIVEDVMELDANYIGHGSTRRSEWNASIESALEEHASRDDVEEAR